jgi:hypothetical protein
MDLKSFFKFSFKVKMIFRCSGIPVVRHSSFYYMPSIPACHAGDQGSFPAGECKIQWWCGGGLGGPPYC